MVHKVQLKNAMNPVTNEKEQLIYNEIYIPPSPMPFTRHQGIQASGLGPTLGSML